MKCNQCASELSSRTISGVGGSYCSYFCYLIFYKKELPNLGGDEISDELIAGLEKLSSEDKEQKAKATVLNTISSLDTSKFFESLN